MPDSLSFKAKMLDLEGVVEVNSLDKEDTLSAVNQLIADVLVTKKRMKSNKVIGSSSFVS